MIDNKKQKKLDTIRKKLLLEGYEARPHVKNTILITGARADEVHEIKSIAGDAKVTAGNAGTLLEL